MKIYAYCDYCRHVHPIDLDPSKPDQQIQDWWYKHAGHDGVWYDWPGRTVKPSWVTRLQTRWRIVVKWVAGLGKEVLTADPVEFGELRSPLLGYLPNANIKTAYAASVPMTFTSVNSLASSSTLVAGANATAVDNTSNLYLDYLLAGFYKNNVTTPPTAGTEIDTYLYRSYDDGPTYPAGLTGSDAAATITTVNMINSGLKLAWSIIVAATTSQVNPFDAGVISGYFGGITPKLWSIWVTHNSGQSLAASGNTVSYYGAFATSI